MLTRLGTVKMGQSRSSWRMLAMAVMIVGSLTVGSFADFSFNQVVIDSSAIAYERDMGDINGDGLTDIVAVPHHGDGSACDHCMTGYLAPSWTKVTLLTLDTGTHGYPYFRIDDFKLADMDDDGDLDAVTRISDSGDGLGDVCWFENPYIPSGAITNTWTQHVAGSSAAYTKDMVIEDMDKDGKLDIVIREKLVSRIYFQDSADSFTRKDISHSGNEGMEVGDLDEDGWPDIVLNGFWLEAPNDPRNQSYTNHSIDSKWYTQGSNWDQNASKISIADIDGDTHPDVVFSHSENTGYPVSWYSADTPGSASTSWTEHVIQSNFYDCHTLHAADFNRDGFTDVLAGGMPQSNYPGLRVFLGDGGSSWTTHVIQTSGSYSSEVADIDDDCDLDIVGIRNWDTGPTEVWQNQLMPSLDLWGYKQIDNARDTSHGYGYFGLGFGGYHRGDGFSDIISGKFFYRNPGGDMMGTWTRTTLPLQCDGMVIIDVDDDAYVDVIAQELPNVYWFEATDVTGSSFVQRQVIGSLNVTDHTNGQGYLIAELADGGAGKEEILMAHGPSSSRTISYFQIPADPINDTWTKVDMTNGANDEGVGVGDIDGDGDLDIACSAMAGTRYWAWWENPGDGSGSWNRYNIALGETSGWLDRCHVADINGDNRPDVIATEENGTGSYDADVMWFEAPVDPKTGSWTQHVITTLCSANSCDVGDMDGDGDVDVVTGDLRCNKQLEVWDNDGSGNFTSHEVDSGMEHHEGARIHDLDGDGDYDIVSIAYFEYQYMHLWRNDGGCGSIIPPDTDPPSVPTGLTSPDQGQTSLSLSWSASTDADSSVAGYRVYRNGGSIGTTAETTYTDSGLTSCETYTYQVGAFDTAVPANESGPCPGVPVQTDPGPQDPDLHTDGVVDVEDVKMLAENWLATGTCILGDINADASVDLIDFLLLAADYTGPDTQAPSVPDGLVVVTKSFSSIAFSWDDSTDNVDVAGYKVFRDGVHWDTTSGTTYSDSGLTAETTYTYQVSAYDTADPVNESALSAPLPVQTDPMPTDLLVYLKMDEGIGSTAYDSSGQDNHGTVNGATWTAADGGYIAYGLDFDGTNDYVDLNSLDVAGSGITIAAWVKPESLSGDHRMISKATGYMEQDHYWMLSVYSSQSYVPRFRLKTGGTTSTLIGSSGGLTTGTWAHVAATYDGSTMGVWRDGDSVGSLAKTGTIATSSSVDSWVGANPGGGGSNWFNGVIDEVRIYERALSETEIEDIMDPQSDTEAPTIPTGLSVDGTTSSSVRLSWQESDDNVGVAGYRVYRDGANIGNTGGLSYTDDGLPASTEYTYQVRAYDAVPNLSGLSSPVQATTDDPEPDYEAPSVPTSLMVDGTSASSVSLSWQESTDNNDVLGYNVYRDGTVSPVGTTAGPAYTDGGLTAETAYTYWVSAFDTTNESGLSTPVVATTTALGAWWNTTWHYRLPVTVTVGSYDRYEKPVEYDIDFNSLLGGSGYAEDSIRVIEVDGSNNVIDADVPFQFDPGDGYDAATNAVGTVVWLLEGTTTAGNSRYYHLYFDSTGSFSGPSITPQVTLTDNVTDVTLTCYEIVTQNSTWYYDKTGGGFSSLDDLSSNDWIDHDPTPGSGANGEYRGIPNLVDNDGSGNGLFHPARPNCTSQIVNTGPIKASFSSTSSNSQWTCLWEIFPRYARLIITDVDEAIDYWFLYEGTPGGALEKATDYNVTSDGTRRNFNTSWASDIPTPEWFIVEDSTEDSFIFFAHEEDDAQTDCGWQYQDAMTVMGFGRDTGMGMFLSGAPRHFVMGLGDYSTGGLSDTQKHAEATDLVDDAFQPVTVTPGSVEQQ